MMEKRFEEDEDWEKSLGGHSALLLTINLKDQIVYFLTNRTNS